MKRAVLIIAFLFLVSCAENNTDIPEKTEKEQSRQAKEDVLLGSFETKILDAEMMQSNSPSAFNMTFL